MVTPADIKLRFTEFSTVDDTRLQIFIDDSCLEVGLSWGKLQDLGVAYLSAHLLTIGTKSSSGSSSGNSPVTSKSVEGISVSYAQPTYNNVSESFLASTTYGQRFLDLKKKIKVGMVKLI